MINSTFCFINSSFILNLQEGQNPGPPPLIPGLGQHGGPGRHGPHNQGPGPNKGKHTALFE